MTKVKTINTKQNKSGVEIFKTIITTIFCGFLFVIVFSNLILLLSSSTGNLPKFASNSYFLKYSHYQQNLDDVTLLTITPNNSNELRKNDIICYKINKYYDIGIFDRMVIKEGKTFIVISSTINPNSVQSFSVEYLKGKVTNENPLLGKIYYLFAKNHIILILFAVCIIGIEFFALITSINKHTI